jgi:hypothetical protein
MNFDRGCLAAFLVAAGAVLLDSSWAASSPRLGAAVVSTDTTACITFQGDSIRPGERVLVFLFSPPRVVDGLVRRASSEPCRPNAALEGQAYRVDLRYAIAESEEIGVAVLDPTARTEYLNGEFVVFTKGAAAPLQMRECSSHEGLHLTAWRGNRRTWHAYFYLGYDLESTCSDEEAGP